MTTLTSTLIVRLLDKVSGPAKTVASSLSGIGRAAQGVNGTMVGRLDTALAANRNRLDEVRGSMVDAVGAALALKGAFASTVMPAVKFESALADVGKVSGFDDKGLVAFGKELRALAAGEIPMAVDELAALSAEAAAAGIDDKELLEFTRMTAKAAVAWGMTGAAAGENLAKIKTALGLTIEETRLYGDAINFVADSLAANAPELLDFSRRVAVQGEFFGFSKEQTLAFGGAMISAGFEADVAATSFRNMGRALTRGGSATERQAQAMGKLGMDSRKVARAMQKDAVGTTLKVIDAVGKIPDHMKASLLSDLFGDETAALIPLIGNTEQLRKALELTADEQKYANSVGKEFAKRAATSEYALQRFQNQVREVGLAIGGALLPGLRDTLAVLGPLAMKLSNFAEANPALVRGVALATTGLVGFRVAAIGLQWGALFARGALLSLVSPVVRLGTWAATAARNAVALQAGLAAMSGLKFGGLAQAAVGLRGIAMAIPGIAGLAGAASGIAAGVAALTAPAWMTIAAGVAAVAAAGAAVYVYWDRITSVVSGVARALGEVLRPALDAVRPALDALAPLGEKIAAGWGAAKGALDAVGNWMLGFFSREILSDGAKAEWSRYGYDLVMGLVNSIKAAFKGLTDFLGSVTIPAPNFDNVIAVFNALKGAIETAVGAIVGAVDRAKAAVSSLGATRVGIGHAGSDPLKPIMNGSAAAALAGTGAARIDGARALGGPVWRGGSFLVGEEGPELFSPDRGGSIIPSADTMAMLRRASSGGVSAGSAARSSAPAGVHIENINIQVHEARNGRETAREVNRLLADELEFALRGIHSDG